MISTKHLQEGSSKFYSGVCACMYVCVWSWQLFLVADETTAIGDVLSESSARDGQGTEGYEQMLAWRK